MSYSLTRSGSLAFMCGFVDTIVFVYMGGLFVAHVTGNFVLLGATVAGAPSTGAHSDVALLQIATFPVFVLAAFLATLFHDRWPSRDAIKLLWAVGILVLTASIWSVLGAAADVGASIILVCAMATLNAAQRLAPEIGPPTTVMTGNTTQVAIALARRWRPREHSSDAAPNLRVPAILVAMFLLGCVLGALSAERFGLMVVALPAALLIIVLASRLRSDGNERSAC